MSLMAEFTALRPQGGFEFIMADPPWRFFNWSAAGEGKNPVAHYPCATLEELVAMPVGMLAARDAVMWMWATNPMLPEALMLLSAWGFTFKTAGTWVKRTKHGREAFGPGYILRSSNEPVLIGTRGSPSIVAKDVRSTVASYGPGVDLRPGEGWPDTVVTVEAPAREHSRKPEAAFLAAERLMPVARRLELFSRASRPGWRAWGSEAGKFDGGEVAHG